MGNHLSCCTSHGPSPALPRKPYYEHRYANELPSNALTDICYSGHKNEPSYSKQSNNATSFENSVGGRLWAGGARGTPRDATQPIANNSASGLQHISEREVPELAELNDDPSTHPSVGTMFMDRSESEMRLKDSWRRSMYIQSLDTDAITSPKQDTMNGVMKSSHHPLMCIPVSRSEHHRIRIDTGLQNGDCDPDCRGEVTSIRSADICYIRKASSCSTIFLDDSTISQPNLKNTLRCISLAIYYHIANRRNRGSERLMDIFDEKLHPLTRDAVPHDYAWLDPEHRQIYRFVRTLFNAAQLTAECAIITLVYIERLLTYAEIDMCGANWRRIVLGAILLASKVWDDQAVWNVDYCQILRDMNVDDVNELERQCLECLLFNINVPSSVYAKYYFDLRTLALANDMQLPLQPLYRERAKKLEAMCRICEDRLGMERKTRRRVGSWSGLSNMPHSSSKQTVVLP